MQALQFGNGNGVINISIFASVQFKLLDRFRRQSSRGSLPKWMEPMRHPAQKKGTGRQPAQEKIHRRLVVWWLQYPKDKYFWVCLGPQWIGKQKPCWATFTPRRRTWSVSHTSAESTFLLRNIATSIESCLSFIVFTAPHATQPRPYATQLP